MDKKKYILVSPVNKFEKLHVELWKRFNNCVIESAEEQKIVLGGHKGIHYEINKETIDLTLKFYKNESKNIEKIVAYYNRILHTAKFEAYIKKSISYTIFGLLENLYILKLAGLRNEKILMVKDPITEFIVRFFEKKHGLKLHLKKIRPVFAPLTLLWYYFWLFKEFFRRGITVGRPKKNYKICKEATWGFYRPTLRDDIVSGIGKTGDKDLLLLGYVMEDRRRVEAFRAAQNKGLDVAYVPALRINIGKNFFIFLFFYLFVPIRTYLRLALGGQLYLYEYIFRFHRECFPIEVLLSQHDIKCHISTKDWGDVAETITLNRHGVKNVIFHWSDLTPYQDHLLAFVAHNIYFTWGDIHYGCHSDNFFTDKKINTGCIFKKEYNEAVSDKVKILSRIDNLKKDSKIAVFFDTSFSDHIFFTEEFFLEYLKIVKEFVESHANIKVLLKPKSEEKYENRLSGKNRYLCQDLWADLIKNGNFAYLDSSKWSVGEVAAVSDLCVSMGMNSPSTIALICGKNALYFDNTGNDFHPFAKRYKDILVFDDGQLLLKQMDNILEGRFNYRDFISEKEIREYDAFEDDNALERIRDSLYDLTSA